MQTLKKALSFLGRHLLWIAILILVLFLLWPNRTNPIMPLFKGEESFSQSDNFGTATGGMASTKTRVMMAQDMEIAPSPMPPIYDGSGFDAALTDRKVIKNASLGMEVKDTEIAKAEAERIISELKGMVTNMNSYETRPSVLAYNLTVRIPSTSLESAVAKIAQLGVKKYENFGSEDITESYADTENQLKNLESRRERLRELMDRETKDLNDVLQIDRELANVQMEIENLQRMQKRRDGDSSFSTLQLSITPEPEVGDFSTPEWTPNKSWKQALNDLIQSSRNIFDGAVRIAVYAPIWLPVLLVLWYVQRRVRRASVPTKTKK